MPTKKTKKPAKKKTTARAKKPSKPAISVFFPAYNEGENIAGLARPSATAIAETPIKDVIDAVKEVDGDDVDIIIQAGTNLSTVDLFPTLEHVLEKPMVPINVATVWHALRACGINDKITGKGRLLEEF